MIFLNKYITSYFKTRQCNIKVVYILCWFTTLLNHQIVIKNKCYILFQSYEMQPWRSPDISRLPTATKENVFRWT